MNQALKIFFYLGILLVGIVSCRQAKYVAEDDYLHRKNYIYFVSNDSTGREVENSHDELDAGAIEVLLKPQTNSPFKLWVYNRIDTAKYQKQVAKRTEKNRKKNQKKKAKVEKINKKRIKKALEKGDSTYYEKTYEPKKLKKGWRHSLRTKFGEAPVLYDSAFIEKSNLQIDIYLNKQGFYNGTVRDSVHFNEKKQKAYAYYFIEPKKPYIITSIAFDSVPENKTLYAKYDNYRNEKGGNIIVGDRVIESNFQKEREGYSKYMRDNAHFGLTQSFVNFVVDTTQGDHEAHVIVFVKKKQLPHPDIEDSTIYVNHKTHRIKQVTYYLYNTDKNSFVNGFENYKRRCDSLIAANHNVVYNPSYLDEKGRYYLLDTLKIEGKGIYVYNGIPYVKPNLLDNQNFLEIYIEKKNNHYYKDYYLERSYGALSNLGIFSAITPKLFLNPQKPTGNEVFVEYHLYPMDKQSFVIEPSATNTNSVLGINGAISYQNINLSRGAQKFKFSITGGFESQPLIVTDSVKRDGFFNTWEIEPKLTLEFPQLVPFHLFTDNLSKRMFPTTQIDLSYNYQNRTEFTRNIASFVWSWKFVQDKVQDWKVNPFYLDFVRLNKEDFFIERLKQLNDPFLTNSYSDHFTTLFGITYHFSNERSNRRIKQAGKTRTSGKHKHDVTVSLKQSGGLMDLSNIGTLDTSGTQKVLFGVPFTQFLRTDWQYIANQYINAKNNMVYRAIVGVGYAYGNSQSLPYEQSFFGGGSNDIRAFNARTMAPGGTQTYLNENSTTTQLGDMKIELNIEWRFHMTSSFEGAVFLDAGNIWKIQSSDPLDPGLFQWDTFIEQSALGSGFGLRMDLEFLLVRLDLAFPLYNPYLNSGERWLFQSHPTYDSYFMEPDGSLEEGYVAPHAIRLNFGIGYPF